MILNICLLPPPSHPTLPFPLMVRINPLVKVRTAGVESWFSVVHPHSSTHSPPAGAWVTTSCGVDRDPILSTWGEPGSPLPFLLVLEASECTSTPPACQPQPQVGGEVASRKNLHFSQNQRDATQLGGGGHSLLEAPAPASVGQVLPDLFGADLPKVMPYWFCTNRVHG